MKFLLILSLMAINLNLWASVESCSKKNIELMGQYGKYKSPLLKTYSEVSGNLTKIEISSKQKFSGIKFVLMDEKGEIVKSENLPLKKNKTASFDFIKLMNELKIRPRQFMIQLEKSNDKIECAENVTIVEKDGLDGVFKRP